MKKYRIVCYIFIVSILLALLANMASSDEIKPPFGEEQQEEDFHQIFLRKSSVLLNPGEMMVDISFAYQRDEAQMLYDLSLSRQLSLGMALQFGLGDGIEGFIRIPVNWSEGKMKFSGEGRRSKFGLGNLDAGVKLLVSQEDNQFPAIIVSFSHSAPTGNDPYSDEIGLGSGHWSTFAGLTMVKSCDPIIIFAGLSCSWIYPRDVNGQNITPGNTIGYNLGIGFVVNAKITLSGQFSGDYQGKTIVDFKPVANTSSERISLQNGLTYALNKNLFLESSVRLGLTEDTPDVTINFFLSRRFSNILWK